MGLFDALVDWGKTLSRASTGGAYTFDASTVPGVSSLQGGDLWGAYRSVNPAADSLLTDLEAKVAREKKLAETRPSVAGPDLTDALLLLDSRESRTPTGRGLAQSFVTGPGAYKNSQASLLAGEDLTAKPVGGIDGARGKKAAAEKAASQAKAEPYAIDAIRAQRAATTPPPPPAPLTRLPPAPGLTPGRRPTQRKALLG